MAYVDGEWQGVHDYDSCWVYGCEGCTDMCSYCGAYVPIREFDTHEVTCEGNYHAVMAGRDMDLGFDALPVSTRMSDAFMYHDDPYVDWIEPDDYYS
jgi:hypothetical protein